MTNPSPRPFGLADGPQPSGALWSLAGWLVVVLGIDLVVTRLLLRLAVFVPKSELAAAVIGPLARGGAVVENVLSLLALVLLGALVLWASGASAVLATPSATPATPLAAPFTAPSLAWRLGLAATIGLAGGGLLLLAVPLTPLLVLGLGASLATAALFFLPAALAGRNWLERIGLGLLTASLVATGLGRGLEGLEALLGAAALPRPEPDAPGGLPAEPTLLLVGGQTAYLLGAVALGLAGLAMARRHATRRRWLLLGAIVALVALVAAVRAPTTSGILLIWMIGLAGVAPLGLVAIAAGLVVAGLGLAQAVSARRAMGPILLVLAGATPATSSLVLVALLGLALTGAGTTAAPYHGLVAPAPSPAR